MATSRSSRTFKPIGPVDYSDKAPPEGYRCSNPKCKSPHGVKLWRQYQTIASEVELLCGPCALAGLVPAR